MTYMIYTCKNDAMIHMIEGSHSWHLHESTGNDAMRGIHPIISMMPHDRILCLVTLLLLVGNLKVNCFLFGMSIVSMSSITSLSLSLSLSCLRVSTPCHLFNTIVEILLVTNGQCHPIPPNHHYHINIDLDILTVNQIEKKRKELHLFAPFDFGIARKQFQCLLCLAQVALANLLAPAF